MDLSPSDLTLSGVALQHREFLGALDAGTNVRAAVAAAYGWDLEAPVPELIVGQIDQIVIRRLNDFVPDTDAPVILDCGANIGISTLHFKRSFPQARIVAFEPDPMLFGILERNLERNGASDVTAIAAATWVADGEMSFAADGLDGGRLEPGAGAPVRTINLTDYLQRPVDLLKLDVESAEYALVSHAFNELARVKNVVVECHINQSTVPQFGVLLQQLKSAGFHVTFNTFGRWRDLVRGGAVGRKFEQYVVVYGSRSAPAAVTPTSSLPYLDIAGLLEFYRSEHPHDGPARYRQKHRGSLDALAGVTKVKLARPFMPDGGRGWRIALPGDMGNGDTIEQQAQSKLILCENGRPIGPPHSQHSAIRQYGGGRFSHWHTALFFSTPDDSDPNTNRRTYSVVVPRQPRPDGPTVTRRGRPARRSKPAATSLGSD